MTPPRALYDGTRFKSFAIVRAAWRLAGTAAPHPWVSSRSQNPVSANAPPNCSMKSQAVPRSAKHHRGIVLPNNLTPISRLNVSGFMKLDNSTAQFDLQAVGRKSKSDDIEVFTLV